MAIAMRFPEVIELAQSADHSIRTIEAELDQREAGGGDTSDPRQILRELRWRLEYTADTSAIRAALARLQTWAALSPSPASAWHDADRGDGGCTDVWFLKLDACVDRILAGDFDEQTRPPNFLDRINDPDRLKEYLESLRVSRLDEDGIDRRKELNFATADLVRLILWRRPRNYPWDPRLDAVIRRAGPTHRVLWRRLPDRWKAASNRGSQPHLSYGSLSRRPDRILAAARRHAVCDS
jgi:hypothetical protein